MSAFVIDSIDVAASLSLISERSRSASAATTFLVVDPTFHRDLRRVVASKCDPADRTAIYEGLPNSGANVHEVSPIVVELTAADFERPQQLLEPLLRASSGYPAITWIWARLTRADLVARLQRYVTVRHDDEALALRLGDSLVLWAFVWALTPSQRDAFMQDIDCIGCVDRKAALRWIDRAPPGPGTKAEARAVVSDDGAPLALTDAQYVAIMDAFEIDMLIAQLGDALPHDVRFSPSARWEIVRGLNESARDNGISEELARVAWIVERYDAVCNDSKPATIGS